MRHSDPPSAGQPERWRTSHHIATNEGLHYRAYAIYGTHLHHSGSQTMDYSGSQILRHYRLGSHTHQYRRHRSSAPVEAEPL